MRIKEQIYKWMKRKYVNTLSDRSFYNNNVKNFFRGGTAIVILASEAKICHERDEAKAKGKKIVDFYNFKSWARPSIAVLKGNNVILFDVDVNKEGKQKSKKMTFWQFCQDYEMADMSEIKVIC